MMYSFWNIALIILAATVAPALRGFAACNAVLIMVYTHAMTTLDPEGSRRVFESNGVSDKRVMYIVDFTTHIVPFLFIIKWFHEIKWQHIIICLTTALSYALLIDNKAVYGIESTKRISTNGIVMTTSFLTAATMAITCR